MLKEAALSDLHVFPLRTMKEYEAPRNLSVALISKAGRTSELAALTERSTSKTVRVPDATSLEETVIMKKKIRTPQHALGPHTIRPPLRPSKAMLIYGNILSIFLEPVYRYIVK